MNANWTDFDYFDIDFDVNYNKFKWENQKPQRPLLTITSYQDLLYKSANRNDYLRLMFELVRKWRRMDADVYLTREYCVEYLDEVIESHINCGHLIEACDYIISTYSLREDEEKSTLSETVTPAPAEKEIRNVSSEMKSHFEKSSWPTRIRNVGYMPPIELGTHSMMEYGWYDTEIETEITELMETGQLTREQAFRQYLREH